MDQETGMKYAIDAARAGIAVGQTPFGAAVVRGGELIAAGHNVVWRTCDPTAHAEITAIRKAAEKLRTIDLTGCEMYTTCEPCPMCAAAIHWSKIGAVYYGATIADAQKAGFAELTVPCVDLYRQGRSGVRVVTDVSARDCAALFGEWLARADHRAY